MKKNNSIFVLITLLSSLFLFSTCRKNDSDSSIDSIESTSKTTIAGLILDEQNLPIVNVAVTCNGYSTTTSAYGTFLFENITVPAKRFIVNYTKAGFFNGCYASLTSANNVSYIKTTMIAKGNSYSIQSSTGGLVTLPDGASILFPPNGYINSTGAVYNGPIAVYAHHLRTDDAAFSFKVPGKDLMATDAAGNSKILQSFGMLIVEMYSAGGEKLNLASTASATLTMPVASFQQSAAPATIPLWHLDEKTALWKEEGSATLNGNNYVGVVHHFTPWNCDSPLNTGSISFRVVDCNLSSISNFSVTIKADGFPAFTVFPNNSGITVWVPSGISISVYVDSALNHGFSSQVESIPTLTVNQSYSTPDLILNPCGSRIIGSTIGCSGNSINSFVILNNSKGTSFYYTNNFNFQFRVFPNELCNLEFYRQNTYHTFSFVSPSDGDSLNVGQVQLCDTISINNLPDNSFIFDGGPFSYNTYFLDTLFNNSNVTAHLDINGHLIIQLDSATTFTMTTQIENAIVGEHIWSSTNISNYFSGNIKDNNLWYFAHTDAPNCTGIINLKQFGAIGQRVRGTLEGTIEVSEVNNPGNVYLVNVIGKFNALRQ